MIPVLVLAAVDVGAVLTSLISTAAPYVLPLLVSGVLALGAMLGRWLHAHTGSSKLGAALVSGVDYVGAAVSHVMAGLQPKLIAALSNDGKIDAAELAGLRDEALKLILAELPDSLKTIASALGEGPFKTWLSGKIGQAVVAQSEQLADHVSASADAQSPQKP